MTIMEAISRIDENKPNSLPLGEKIRLLSVLDGLIKSEIIDTHERCQKPSCSKDIEFKGYSEESDLSTVMLVPTPYDDVYIRWLETQIDNANGEYQKYNNSVQIYNTAFKAFANYYNRTHMPIGKKFKFF